MKNDGNKIQIQAANVYQGTHSDGTKTDWLVRENITGVELFKLRSTYKEDEVFEILAFARKFELIAFNVGIDFGKAEAKKYYETVINGKNEVLKALTAENSRLAEVLDKKIKGA